MSDRLLRAVIGRVKKRLQYAALQREPSILAPQLRHGSEPMAVVFPASVPGGVGDDAMVCGAFEGLRDRVGGIAILAESAARGLHPFAVRAQYLNLWSDWRPVWKVLEALPAQSSLFILGADILDGHYSYADAARRVRLARIASQVGLPSRIVGFSLNDSPAEEVVREFRRLPADVQVFLRDPVSFERARRIMDGNVQLSADVAFLLRPTPGSSHARALQFAQDQRRRGNAVIGINIHELFRKTGDGALDRLCASLADLIAHTPDAAFILIPHDFRTYVDDRRPLRVIQSLVPTEVATRTLLLDSPMQAAEIKQICELTDGIVTGRMHLAIAALGMHKPVLGIVYQGKFEGTFSYFGIEGTCVMTPLEAGEPKRLRAKFADWRTQLDATRRQIETALPQVNHLARKNFA